MTNYNDIGISGKPDWPRIQKLLTIGLIASLLFSAENLWLGWGMEDTTLTGLPRLLSACTGRSDAALFAIAVSGMAAITLMGLSSFGVYRLMAEKSPDYAHRYRSGIFGVVIFGGCGYHVPLCALVYLARHLGWTEIVQSFAAHFFFPAAGLFFLSFLFMQLTQIKAFAKGLTPCSRICWIFTPLLPMLLIELSAFSGNDPLINALHRAWVGLGGVWMFGGLLAAIRRCKNAD